MCVCECVYLCVCVCVYVHHHLTRTLNAQPTACFLVKQHPCAARAHHTCHHTLRQALVERPPYAGAVGLSLMAPPHVEAEVPLPPAWPLLGGVDLLALPGARGLFRLGLRLAARQLMVYPKCVRTLAQPEA